MRFLASLTLPFVLWLSSCSPLTEKNRPTPSPIRTEFDSPGGKPPQLVGNPQPEEAATPTLPQPGFSPKVTRREIAGLSFEGVAFSSSTHRLVVVDQAAGPGSRFPDARAAAASLDGVAASNAGFFTPEGKPLGKVIASGNHVGSWNRSSSLGAGVFSENAAGMLSIARREKVSSSGYRELLQAGPMILENGRPVSGLDHEKPAIRILLLWDGGSRWWLGRSSICTLAELGSALGKGSPAGWPVRHALNLDGGRSSNLWISGKVSGEPINFRSLFSRPVRNFLVLVNR